MSAALNYRLKPESDRQVAIARREGRLPAADGCEACDTTKGRIVLHHHDYAKPMEVIPLCCSCHQMVHSGRIPEPRTGRAYPRKQKRPRREPKPARPPRQTINVKASPRLLARSKAMAKDDDRSLSSLVRILLADEWRRRALEPSRAEAPRVLRGGTP